MKFPIIVVDDKDPMVYSYSDEKTLKKTSKELLAKNIWKGCKLIDSDGYEYRILNVKNVGSRGLMGWNPFIKGTLIWIDFELSDKKEVNIEEFKTLLLHKVSLSKNFWKESFDIDHLNQMIKQSTDFETLIQFFL